VKEMAKIQSMLRGKAKKEKKKFLRRHARAATLLKGYRTFSVGPVLGRLQKKTGPRKMAVEERGRRRAG